MSTTSVISVWRNDRNYTRMFMVLLKNLAHKGLRKRDIVRPMDLYTQILPIPFRVTSQALGQSYDNPSIREVALKNVYKSMGWNISNGITPDSKVHGANCFSCTISLIICLQPHWSLMFLGQLDIQYKKFWIFLEIWAPSQYKDRLIYVWRFPC